MSDSGLSELIERLRLAAEKQYGAQPGSELKAVLNELAALPTERSDDITAELLALLASITAPAGAGFLCAWLGAGVEGGRPAAQSAPAVFEAFKAWAATLPADEDEEGADGTPESEADQTTLVGLNLLGTSVVTHLARLSEVDRQNAELGALHAAAKRISHLSNGAAWVEQALSQQSGELIVLIVDKKKGFRLRYSNIANCFHLFTLLQAALVPQKSRRTSAMRSEAVAAALGKSTASGIDQAWWHYGQPFSPEPNLAASIWGEGPPSQIAKVAGKQVLLAWPPLLGSRTWDHGFFGPVLQVSPPEVKLIDVLNDEEVDRYWKQLKLAEPGPWWKFW